MSLHASSGSLLEEDIGSMKNLHARILPCYPGRDSAIKVCDQLLSFVLLYSETIPPI